MIKDLLNKSILIPGENISWNDSRFLGEFQGTKREVSTSIRDARGKSGLRCDDGNSSKELSSVRQRDSRHSRWSESTIPPCEF